VLRRESGGIVNERRRLLLTPKPFPAGWWARCHRARGDIRALHTGRRVWSRGTRVDIGALPWRVACLVPRGTWRCQSSLVPGADLEPQGRMAATKPSLLGAESGVVGLDLSLVHRDTRFTGYRQ
jgi:hypothetical protein